MQKVTWQITLPWMSSSGEPLKLFGIVVVKNPFQLLFYQEKRPEKWLIWIAWASDPLIQRLQLKVYQLMTGKLSIVGAMKRDQRRREKERHSPFVFHMLTKPFWTNVFEGTWEPCNKGEYWWCLWHKLGEGEILNIRDIESCNIGCFWITNRLLRQRLNNLH